MKKSILMLVAILISVLSFGQGQVHVNGYTRSNGTYVQSHERTTPNSTRNDNWSTIGNVNPYTGIEGTKPRDNSYSTPVLNTYSTDSHNSFSNFSNSSFSTPMQNPFSNSDFSNSYYSK